MEEIMEKLKQVNRILTGEEGPELALNYAEDARYIYPEKIAMALKVLAEMEYLLTRRPSRAAEACACSEPAIYDWYGAKHCSKCGLPPPT
ncbi:unnamed protein product [marine sediment metagenome]|uniref:Uncharacterized protein n=1 Tax=marine sediment metagenome TaxID=412755 RepID=X1E2W5_9ZZZZ